MKRFDIVIAGGGIVGLSLALTLKRVLRGALSVCLIESTNIREDDRAFAFSAGSRRLLQALGVWHAIMPEAQPIHEMVITDSRLDDPIRPAFLTFGLNGEPPPLWLVLSFAIVGVSAHVANALPDIESDTASGSGGFAISLGRVRATRLCWILLILGTFVLATESVKSSIWYPVVLVVAIAGSWTLARFSRNRSAVFTAILACVFVELVVLLISVGR